VLAWTLNTAISLVVGFVVGVIVVAIVSRVHRRHAHAGAESH
jgi:predicted DNA repair protein MutK